MRIAVNTVLGTAVGLPLIGVVEPSNGQYSFSQNQKIVIDSPVATIFVRRRSRPHHVRRTRLADSALQELWQNRDIEHIAGVDEGARS